MAPRSPPEVCVMYGAPGVVFLALQQAERMIETPTMHADATASPDAEESEDLEIPF
jgi:hypothetical protein